MTIPGTASARASRDSRRRSIPIAFRCKLVAGADAHVDAELPAKLRSGDAPSLAGSRYFLLEPPHHVAPPRFADFVFNLLAAGFVPLITHPERLSWIEDHYATFCSLVDQGAWLQVTAGSLTGRFGSRPRYWGERLLDEGRVHVLATDAHGVTRRPPLLAEGRAAAERRGRAGGVMAFGSNAAGRYTGGLGSFRHA